MLPPDERNLFLNHTTLAYVLKRHMVPHNVYRIKAIGNPVAPIAALTSKIAHFVTLGIGRADFRINFFSVREQNFLLTSNLWTPAGFTNGATGYVHSILYNQRSNPLSLPEAIIATFEAYLGPPCLKHVSQCVPIIPVRRQWMRNGVSYSRKQLPIILGYGLSIHKLQGSTCDRLILNPGRREFAAGLMFVGATWTKILQRLLLDPMPNFDHFDLSKINEIQRRIEEKTRMAAFQDDTIARFSTAIQECCAAFQRFLT